MKHSSQEILKLFQLLLSFVPLLRKNSSLEICPWWCHWGCISQFSVDTPRQAFRVSECIFLLIYLWYKVSIFWAYWESSIRKWEYYGTFGPTESSSYICEDALEPSVHWFRVIREINNNTKEKREENQSRSLERVGEVLPSGRCLILNRREKAVAKQLRANSTHRQRGWKKNKCVQTCVFVSHCLFNTKYIPH